MIGSGLLLAALALVMTMPLPASAARHITATCASRLQLAAMA